jgi:hypothetical protein
MIHIVSGLEEGDIVMLNPPLKSGTITEIDHNDITNPEVEVRQKIASTLNDINSNGSSAKQESAADGENSESSSRKGRRENLDPQQLEEMRKRLEQMTPEEREKLRSQRRNRSEQPRTDQP